MTLKYALCLPVKRKNNVYSSMNPSLKPRSIRRLTVRIWKPS